MIVSFHQYCHIHYRTHSLKFFTRVKIKIMSTNVGKKILISTEDMDPEMLLAVCISLLENILSPKSVCQLVERILKFKSFRNCIQKSTKST